MVFYFTGTGNSLWVAKQLADLLSEPLQEIPELLNSSERLIPYQLNEGEKLILVYPVHSWGPPLLIKQFIERLDLKKYAGQPVYSVCTCGDECGYTTEILSGLLAGKGIALTGSFSVTMPNNYILFPGFDVDKPEVENKKLTQAPVRMDQIVNEIRQKTGEDLYTVGTFPFVKSRWIYPLFMRYALGRNSFYALDTCISCGLCERTCPTHTIGLEKGKPVWNNTCVQCLACIHRCPVRAIEYGKETLKKGRYKHPEMK